MAVASMVDDGSERRAIAAVLDAAASDEALFEQYVLKGGLALQLAYGSPRRSDDLDFNAVHPTSNDITDATTRLLFDFANRLDDSMANIARGHGFDILGIDRQLLSKEIPTLMADIAYTSTAGASGHVKFQLTLSEIVCASARHKVDGVAIHTATLEDILAEKLKALLQQISRDKVRSTDVFDLWYFTANSGIEIDTSAVTQFLVEKKKQWGSMPLLEKSQFRRKSLIQKSAERYSDLEELLPSSFELLPFREAYECILRFVDRLDLPD